jgi:hypothetical protein
MAILVMSAGLATPAAIQDAAPGPCAAAVSRQLQAWGATGPPRDEPRVKGDALTRYWPTATIGTWVVESRTPRELVLLRVTPARLTRLEWSDGCVVRSENSPRPSADEPRFTDHDLAALVSGGRAGVVYVWSPHMPLSVDGYGAITAAAAARGMTVHAILAPGADAAFARTSLARGGLPESALRVADSIELWHRDVHLHTPAILVYARGRVVGDAWPGYHSAEEYGAFLDRATERR